MVLDILVNAAEAVVFYYASVGYPLSYAFTKAYCQDSAPESWANASRIEKIKRIAFPGNYLANKWKD
ncbi:MAG: hypothetical protein V1678_03695 [Candidatus Aenigmatarchaeota archaeon]